MEGTVQEIVQTNSPMVQSLIFYEQARRGWGPSLYGLLEDGRIEEFVDCHTLKQEEAFEPELSSDVAKAYARFHSLRLPIKQENFDMMKQSTASLDKAKGDVRAALDSGRIKDEEAREMYKRLLDFPVLEEREWLYSLRRKVKQRTVFCTMDPNYLNRLVRTQKPSDPDHTRTLIIDFDFSAFSDRGYDLGGHFVNRLFKWGGKADKLSHLPYPSEAERAHFLSSYLKECQTLFDDFDKTSLDSLENVTLEAELNALIYIITIFSFGFATFVILEQQPKIFTFIGPMIELYEKLKADFSSKYPKLAQLTE